jgi:cysteine sulfinate desulfinase/cysteine desulfurase-like protein
VKLPFEFPYLDHNSIIPIDTRVLDAMLPFLKDNFANPSSTRYFGQNNNEKVKQAREQIADFIKAVLNELIFTSGAAEAINIAIKGVAENNSNRGKHIITITTEHRAVVESYHILTIMGLVEDAEAFGSVRYSLGKFNTQQEVSSPTSLFKELVTRKYIHA